MSQNNLFSFIVEIYIFVTFSPIYFLIMFLTWHKILAKKLIKFCNWLQLWYVIISMMSFYSLTVLKNSTHLKIMAPGLRGPAGGPCKSGDIAGWGLSAPTSLTRGAPWNSMEHGVYQFRWLEQFRGIPRNLGMPQFRWHEQFHGIPWNLECAKFADTNSTMEFHETSPVIKNGNFEVAYILLEFEACMIPIFYEWWCWSTAYTAPISPRWIIK